MLSSYYDTYVRVLFERYVDRCFIFLLFIGRCLSDQQKIITSDRLTHLNHYILYGLFSF